MRARIGEIPAVQDATWAAVIAALLRTHPREWEFDWTGHGQDEPDAHSVVYIKAPGEDVAEMRAEIEAVVDLVNDIVDREPLNQMVRVDAGLVEVLVD